MGGGLPFGVGCCLTEPTTGSGRSGSRWGVLKPGGQLILELEISEFASRLVSASEDHHQAARFYGGFSLQRV